MDYLLGSRIQNLTNAWSFVEKLKSFTASERTKVAPPPPVQPTSKTKKKPSKKSKSPATTAAAVASPEDAQAVYLKDKYSWNLALLECHRGLTRALFQYAIGLRLDDLLPADATVYGSPSIRFAHRFQPFGRLQYPAPLSYDDFVTNCDFSQYKVLVYQSADECFKLARTRVDQVLAMAMPNREHVVPELKALVKVCVTNAVYLHQYTKQRHNLQTTNVVLGGVDALSIQDKKTAAVIIKYDVHPTYPTIQVKDPVSA
ncbi:hypothetical protein DYB25_002426 [Aphanomyces astaci]|uniref:NAA35-like TPR repeats domain-containing protein n=2 Tax=Aphanomyces astaci TaxID=112090 RepID=A0A397BEZ2_APHAT|nr:hypothetical protein DYB25_002426 [Aphanomyces astaci]RHY45165.1 hypothetical protein DYB30_012422 [Aphanomyces astaci]RHY69005.1 hypothetical protein DYB34_002900 [Aphanomyces astaci]RHY71716.1 hypothetical protein DYB38_003239 [Aphanomyces astaci]